MPVVSCHINCRLDATLHLLESIHQISEAKKWHLVMTFIWMILTFTRGQCAHALQHTEMKNYERIWRKIWFCIPYKTHNGSDIHGSISFMIDNMHYVILRIWEQDSVPWCGEIQNKRLEVLGNTFNLYSNSTFHPRSVVSQSVSMGE